MNQELLEKLKTNCEHILVDNYNIKKENKTVIIYDEETKLAKILTSGYEEALKSLSFEFISFNFFSKEHEETKEIIDNLNPEDLVILIQSSSFRMSKYRWRNLLFQANLKVIEHPQLEKNLDTEIKTYINSLNYDLDYYKKTSKFLISKLENAKNIKIISSDGSIAEYTGPMDRVFDNMANFEGKENWGTRFPVGEVLTESLDLKDLNGDVLLYCYPDLTHRTQIVEPFKCYIENGILISHKGPKGFDEVIQMIKEENEEKEVFIRELGLGINRSIKKFDRLGDISSYERLVGLHFSLGMKHGIYQKKLWPKYGKKFYQRFHIDVFVDLKEILIDEEKIYEEGKGWILG